MVADPRTPARADQLRPLNLPHPVRVQTRGPGGPPTTLIERGRRRRVAHVADIWCIEDEWWRHPISRRYFRLALEDGEMRTVFHDRVEDAWHAQTY